MSTLHKSRKALLTDIRSVIGTVLIIFGVYLLVCGFVANGPEEMAKTGGINANLYSGIALLISGLVMLIWALLSPDGGKSPDAPHNDSSSSGPRTIPIDETSAAHAAGMASGASAVGTKSPKKK